MVTIEPYGPQHREAVLSLSMRAWDPVFPLVEQTVPGFVYESFYPNGWRNRQYADLAAALDGEPESVDVALDGSDVVGWICTRIHPEDNMSEIYVLAVDPSRQREGIARTLMERSFDRAREAGVRMVMVETGDDPGHQPARTVYEGAGFVRWPVARYFKDLSSSTEP